MLKVFSFFVTLLSFSFLSYQAKANIGFTQGSSFTATPVQGEVRVTCTGFNGNGNAAFSCRDLVLEPVAYDYFIGPKSPAADKLELIAHHEDGSTRSRVSDYNGAKGRTKEAVNLWISTLFQKPLLEKGRNRVQYRLYANRDEEQTLASGDFEVEVRRGASRSCPGAELQSTDINDCHSQYSVCQRYFEEHNYCR